tara:strand:+ start:56 stop:634 length:579 start_codon:yes stop_codon:yes gene_type:complete
MKIVHDVLSLRLLKKIDEEFGKGISNHNWSSSHLVWEPELINGILGTCLLRELPDNLCQLIIKEIEPHIPPYSKIKISYQCWLPTSGISIHNDFSYEWAATIYLNEKWPLNSGGWFLWDEEKHLKSSITDLNLNDILKQDEWRAIPPNRNMMVINDKQQYHCVTPISHNVSTPRITLQIWSLKKEVKKGFGK